MKSHNPSTIAITVLMENQSPDEQLAVEHGLSFHLQAGSQQILFDTGQSGAFIDNAQTLEIDLEELSTVVLSHGHYDHTGGLERLLSTERNFAIHAHPDAVITRYSIRDAANPRMVGIPAGSLQALRDHGFSETAAWTTISQGIHITGAVPRVTTYEDTGGPFFLDSQQNVPDPITDDQALCFEGSEGLIIVLGCAHAGIINTVRYCRKMTGNDHVHAIIGGFHLLNASAERMERTIQALREINAPLLAPCHCTGEEQTKQLSEAFPDTFRPCHCGSRFRLGFGAAG